MNTKQNEFQVICREGDIEKVKLMIESMSNQLEQLKEMLLAQDQLALRIACQNGHLDVVRFLTSDSKLKDFQCLSDPRLMNGDAFMLAALDGHVEVVRYLMEDPIINKEFPGLMSLIDVNEALLEVCQYKGFEVFKYWMKSGLWKTFNGADDFMGNAEARKNIHVNAFGCGLAAENQEFLDFVMSNECEMALNWGLGQYTKPTSQSKCIYYQAFGRFFIHTKPGDHIENIMTSSWFKDWFDNFKQDDLYLLFSLMFHKNGNQEENLQKMKNVMDSRKIEQGLQIPWDCKNIRDVIGANHFKVLYILMERWVSLGQTKDTNTIDLEMGKQLMANALVNGHIDFLNVWRSSFDPRKSCWSDELNNVWIDEIKKALKSGDEKIVEFALKFKEDAQLDDWREDLCAWFLAACEGGNETLLNLVLDRAKQTTSDPLKIIPKEKRENGLQMAALNGHVNVMKYLLGFQNQEGLQKGYSPVNPSVLKDLQFLKNLMYKSTINSIEKEKVSRSFEWMMLNYGLEETSDMRLLFKQYPDMEKIIQPKRESESLHQVLNMVYDPAKNEKSNGIETQRSRMKKL